MLVLRVNVCVVRDLAIAIYWAVLFGVVVHSIDTTHSV